MRKFVVALATTVAVLMTSTPSQGQTAPPVEVEQPGLDPSPGGNPDSPLVILPGVISALEALQARVARSDGTGRDSLGKALADTRQAVEEYTGGSTDIRAVIGALAKAANNVDKVRSAGDGDRRQLAAAGDALAGVARSLAVKIVERAGAAGVDTGQLGAARAAVARGDARRVAGDFGAAAQAYGEGASKGASGLHFDLDTFEREILKMATGVTGFAYTINVNGKLARADARGQARTAADDPARPHSPDTEQFLASVSKTITGVAMLRALQDAGISVDSSVNPYLPGTWTRGQNAPALTFRNFLTHTSGFSGNGGSTYELLRARIGQPFVANAGYTYSNANFALMRILIPRVSGGKLPFEDFTADDVLAQAHAEKFEAYVRTKILQPAGIDGRCGPTDGTDTETRYYNFPADNQPGYDEPDRFLSCGGFAWYLSSNELGAFMAHLRYTATLLSPAMRKVMDTGFLGWLDPTFFLWSEGVFGTYHNHGGDWDHDPGEAHTCIMKFHITVEASVVMNSGRGFTGHQCQRLRNAFDAAWIA